MIAIVLGYATQKRDSDPVNLFTGGDGGEAKKIFRNPPAGYLRTEIFLNPQGQRRNHDGEGAGFEDSELTVEFEFGEDLETNAGILYEAYCKAVGGKAFNGDPLPSWADFRADSQKNKQSEAWIKTAETAMAGKEITFAAKEFEALKAKFDEQGKLIDRANADANQRAADLSKISSDLSNATARVSALEKELGEANGKLISADAEIGRLNEIIDSLKASAKQGADAANTETLSLEGDAKPKSGKPK